MEFSGGHNGAHDRVGGFPSHVPPEFPTCEDTGEEMTFLLQLYVDGTRLNLPEILCLQLYQCRGVDEGEDLHPIVLALPLLSHANLTQQGSPCSYLDPYDIHWRADEDPDLVELPRGYDEKTARLYESKLGGAPAFPEEMMPGDVFLGQIAERPIKLNFGGASVLLVTRNGGVELLLA